MEIISREDARELGKTRFFTGEPCIHGHIAERLVCNQACAECSRQTSLRSYYKHRDKNRQQLKDWKKANRDRVSEYNKQYYLENKERENQRSRQWKRNNRDKINENRRRRLREDPVYRMEKTMRDFLTRCLRQPKSKRSQEVLGYTAKELKDHIESQFSKGMSWENHGEWHIDHIVPVSTHIKNGQEDPQVINALTNLMPIWAKDNFSKSDQNLYLI